MSSAARGVVHRYQDPFSAWPPLALAQEGTGPGWSGPAARAVTARNACASIDTVMCRYQAWYPADLVVVQAGLVLGLGEAAPYSPAGAGHGHQLGQGRAARREAQEIGELLLALLAAARRPADQQPVIAAGRLDQCPVM